MSKLTDRAKKLKTDIPAVFLALKEKRTPWYAKIIAALIAWCVKCIPNDVFMDCRRRAEGMWGNGSPEKWYYAVPFVLIWLAVIALIIMTFT